MRLRLVSLAFIVVGFLTIPPPAFACSYGGSSPLRAISGAEVVFVGTVTRVEKPQPLPAGLSVSGPGWGIATFDVVRAFRGELQRQVVVVQDGCESMFKTGETWLIYAFHRDSHLRTNKGTRSRLHADAEQDLSFLEGLAAARPQGIVWGDVRRLVTGDGKTASQLPTEALVVIAASGTQRFAAATGRSGELMIVLPPGTFDVWVERAGQPVSPRQRVRLEANLDHRLDLPVSY